MNSSKIVLITGGSRSGKSTFAEELLKDQNDVLYIATAKVTDEEMKDRIQKHQQRRNKEWTTYEGYKNLDAVVEKDCNHSILLDCVTIMTTNLMFDNEGDFDHMTMEETDQLLLAVKKEFEKFIQKAKAMNKTLVMVTNEVGSGLVPEYKLSRVFRDIAGSTNQFIASFCDEVYFVTCGIPLKLK